MLAQCTFVRSMLEFFTKEKSITSHLFTVFFPYIVYVWVCSDMFVCEYVCEQIYCICALESLYIYTGFGNLTYSIPFSFM